MRSRRGKPPPSSGCTSTGLRMGSIRVRRLCLASLMNGMVAGYGVGSVNTPTSKKLPQRSWKEHWHKAEYVARGRSWIGEWWCGSGVENVAVVAGTGLCGVCGGSGGECVGGVVGVGDVGGGVDGWGGSGCECVGGVVCVGDVGWGVDGWSVGGVWGVLDGRCVSGNGAGLG